MMAPRRQPLARWQQVLEMTSPPCGVLAIAQSLGFGGVENFSCDPGLAMQSQALPARSDAVCSRHVQS